MVLGKILLGGFLAPAVAFIICFIGLFSFKMFFSFRNLENFLSSMDL